jgi:hypothetical protein
MDYGCIGATYEPEERKEVVNGGQGYIPGNMVPLNGGSGGNTTATVTVRDGVATVGKENP